MSNPLTYDIALVYAGLVKAGGDLSPEEAVDFIYDRVAVWEPEVDPDAVRSTVEEAFRDLEVIESNDSVSDAAERIGRSLSPAQRRVLLSDLVNTALLDDWYLHREDQFISRLAKRWEVHPSPVSAGQQRLWTILEQSGSNGDWAPVHDLVLVYLFLAHGADQQLSRDELVAIAHKLAEWLPAALPSDVEAVVQKALARYAEGPDPAAIDRAVEVVGRCVPAHQRDAVIADLNYVARADSVVLVEEKAIIARLRQQWKGVRSEHSWRPEARRE